nr:IS30 family transposase [Spirosoma oryzae]
MTLAQRYLIQSLYQQHKTQHFIAQQIGVSQATISRELARHSIQWPPQPYQAQLAQQRAGAAHKRTPYKLNGSVLTTVLNRLRDRLSPQQICGELHRTSTQQVLHHETIYRYIYRHQASNGKQLADHESLIEYLRIRHRKRYNNRGKPVRRQLIPNRVSIDQRPPIVATNTELGHWEADTVIGKGHDGALLTLVERRTKYVLIAKLASKQAGALAAAATKALGRSALPVKTITFDNGLEFVHHESIGRAFGAATCFAHPYYSWERGLNENTNGLIRQYIPKTFQLVLSGLLMYPHGRPRWIEDQLNQRPRTSLGYLSPAEFAKNELYALQM